MTKEQLKEEILKGLRNTVATEVTLQIEQVLALVGQTSTEKLAQFVVETHSPLTIKKNSAIPPEKRLAKVGLAKFNREAIIAAIESGALPAVPAPVALATPAVATPVHAEPAPVKKTDSDLVIRDTGNGGKYAESRSNNEGGVSNNSTQ